MLRKTAVEMDCTLHVSFRTLKGEAKRRGIRYPIFERDDYFTNPEMAAPRRFIAAIWHVHLRRNKSIRGRHTSFQKCPFEHDKSVDGARLVARASILYLQCSSGFESQ
ncbi:MAG: hypothetical protein Ct9H300mP11_27840 [Chloroflexota bacterium]|nr:MAG: hypothetical protein Ct9H300mP11_27840 [Chloroflexota bacterium]